MNINYRIIKFAVNRRVLNMQNTDTLIQLVGSLTRQEKKELSSWFKKLPDSDFALLYKLLLNNDISDSQTLKNRFLEKASGKSYNSAATYLLDHLLRKLADMRRESDSYYMLLGKLTQARVLFEKALYPECYKMLEDIKRESAHYNNHFTMLLAQRMEIEYHLLSDPVEYDERRIIDSHSQIGRTVRFIAKFNEQTSLYELIRYRMMHFGYARSEEDVRMLDDLVTNELQIISAARTKDDFEIQKNHKLFQAYYFIMCGHTHSALSSFKELHQLFEENRHLWHNPPFYYLATVRGMLESLRIIHDYAGVDYFLEKLRRLESKSGRFMLTVRQVITVNRLYSKIDSGDYYGALSLIEKDPENIIRQADMLSANEQAELANYVAIVYLCVGRLREARHVLRPCLHSHVRMSDPSLYISIRLLNTMIYFQMEDSEFVSSQHRSIVRELSSCSGRRNQYKVELFLLRFMDRFARPESLSEREALWSKAQETLSRIALDRYENQRMRCFDYALWVKAMIFGQTVAETSRD